MEQYFFGRLLRILYLKISTVDLVIGLGGTFSTFEKLIIHDLVR